MPSTALAKILLGVVLLLSVGAGGQSRAPDAAKYLTDLQSFFEKMDATYPFFELKKIGKDWKQTKARLFQSAKRCKSDEDFVRLLVEGMKCLRDGHMGFSEINVKLEPDPEFWPGVSFLPATRNRVVVMATANNLKSALPPGTVVTRIHGMPARKYLEARGAATWKRGGHFSSPQRARFFEYRMALSGKRGDKHRIHYRVGRKERSLELVCNQERKGWPHNYHPPKDLVQSSRSAWHTELEGGFGYLYLRRIDEDIEKGIAAAIDAHPSVKGWVVDLRGNGGGGYDRSLKMLIRDRLKRPVVGILDAGCFSSGETFARDLVNYCSAHLIGATTAGSSSSKEVWEAPSGLVKIRYSVRGHTGHDGRVIEYNGVRPHEAVEAVPEEVARGLNSEILRAVEYLVKRSR